MSPKPVPPTNKKYQCPMCFQDYNPVGFGRKSDFKKHLHNFHGADVTWICRTKNCHLSFATERAYSTHAKEAHRMDALPNGAARTELCPQLVFSCGFSDCKDRVFEAQNKDESSESRDRYFEHIAKHFEDGFDVANWEYHIQIHNLMRQHKVKPVWKNCIWPKDKRQGLVWKPRSSGDLRRMLECRHLGEDISMLVRLAFILGTAPFTTNNIPPPSEIDLHFQLPFRSQCLVDTEPPSVAPDSASIKSDGTGPEVVKRRASIPQAMLSVLPNRRSRRETRPSTPASGISDAPMRDTTMRDDFSAGPHPGTPMVIPNESYVPVDAPTFVPETKPLSRPIHTPPEPEMEQQHFDETQPDPPYVYTMSHVEDPHNAWCGEPMMSEPDHPDHQQQYYVDAGPIDIDEYYNYPLSSSQASTVRPATPVPNKRPASWGKVASMEGMRPKKKMTPFDTPLPPDEEIPPSMMYGTAGPTSAPIQMAMDGHYDQPSYDLPMRVSHELAMQQQQHHHRQQGYPSISHLPPQMQLNSPTTFFFDDERQY